MKKSDFANKKEKSYETSIAKPGFNSAVCRRLKPKRTEIQATTLFSIDLLRIDETTTEEKN